MKISLLSVALGMGLTLAGVAAFGFFRSAPTPQLTASVPLQTGGTSFRSSPDKANADEQKVVPPQSSLPNNAPQQSPNQTASLSPRPAANLTSQRNQPASGYPTANTLSSTPAVPVTSYSAPASQVAAAPAPIYSVNASGEEEFVVPAGVRLPAALVAGPVNGGGAAQAQVQDNIANNFLDQLQPGSNQAQQPSSNPAQPNSPSADGTPAPVNPGGQSSINPNTFDSARRNADELYRSIFGYQEADRAQLEAALDAVQSQ